MKSPESFRFGRSMRATARALILTAAISACSESPRSRAPDSASPGAYPGIESTPTTVKPSAKLDPACTFLGRYAISPDTGQNGFSVATGPGIYISGFYYTDRKYSPNDKDHLLIKFSEHPGGQVESLTTMTHTPLDFQLPDSEHFEVLARETTEHHFQVVVGKCPS